MMNERLHDAHASRARALRRLTGLVVVFVAGAAAACTEVTSNLDAPVSVSFDVLPAPAVVFDDTATTHEFIDVQHAVGDTMRDINGVATPLRPIAYNVRGKRLPDQPFTYLVSDTTASLVVTAEGYVIALKGRPTAVPVIAKLPGLPDVQTLIYITSRPDSVEPVAASLDTVRIFPTDSALRTPEGLVRVLHDTVQGTTAATVPVGRYLVELAIVNAAPTLAESVSFVTPAPRQTSIDTTDASGIAGRVVRVKPRTGLAAGLKPDSIVVTATVRYRGRVVGNAAKRVVIPVCLGQPASTGTGRVCVASS
jgi:hypothetical protein